MIFFMAKMKYWNGTTWEILDAKDADTIDGKHFTDIQNDAQSKVDTHANVNASTSKKGHVQLTDSVSSTSTTTAATPNSVKQAYDKANAALPKTGGTMTGILTSQSNTSYTVRQVRNIILSTADADVGAMQNGDIWIKYK
jgi:phage-related tail fiber protein